MLIVSDLHRREAAFEAVLNSHRTVDYIFFLGDGYVSAERIAQRYEKPIFVGVRGNCDSFLCSAPEEMVLDLDGVRLFLHHGHTTGVKHGLGGAIAAALRHDADVCFFGHTHEPYLTYERPENGKPFYLFNPGSIGQPYDGICRYGIMEVREGNILLSHGNIQ